MVKEDHPSYGNTNPVCIECGLKRVCKVPKDLKFRSVQRGERLAIKKLCKVVYDRENRNSRDI